MTTEPRVWVGAYSMMSIWRWIPDAWIPGCTLCARDIFVPGNQPRPTVDPSEMKTIATCKGIDWDD